MKKIIPLFLFLVLLLPCVLADLRILKINESSNILFNKNLNVELDEANVEIVFPKHGFSYLLGEFKIFSNEEKPINSIVYLKSKSTSCGHGGCSLATPEYTACFMINPIWDISIIDGFLFFDKGICTEKVETPEGVFPAANFVLLPHRVNRILVYQETILLPFNYYLDTLSNFRKATYERIIIRVDADRIINKTLKINFNDKYPIKKINETEYVWEYYDMNISDEYLKDILKIDLVNQNENSVKHSFLIKFFIWLRNLFD